MNDFSLVCLVTAQGERWVIWQSGERITDDGADTLACRAGRLVFFAGAQEARAWAAVKDWTLSAESQVHDFTAVPQHLHGEQSQADASALLGIWNLSMDLAQGLPKLEHPVMSRSAAYDLLHDQLTALAIPWLVPKPPQWADLDGSVLEQVMTQATSLFEQQFNLALQA